MNLSSGQSRTDPGRNEVWRGPLLTSLLFHLALLGLITAGWQDSRQAMAPALLIDIEVIEKPHPSQRQTPPRPRLSPPVGSKPQHETVVPNPGRTPADAPAVRSEAPTRTTTAPTPTPQQRAPEPTPQTTAEQTVPPAEAAPHATPSQPLAAAAPGPPAATQKIELPVSDYQRQLKALIEKRKRYPLPARRARLQGRATVAFRLDPDGRLLTTELVHSSGHPLLDRAALQAVQVVGRYPAPPAGMDSETRVRVDLVFKLTD